MTTFMRQTACWFVGIQACLVACLSAPPPLETGDASVLDAAELDRDGASDGAAAATPDALIADAIDTPNSHAAVLASDSNHYFRTIDEPPNLNVVSTFTLEVWFKLASLPMQGANFALITKANENSVDNSYRLQLNNDMGTYQFIARAEGDRALPLPMSKKRETVAWVWPTAEVNQWHHAAVTYDLAQPTRVDSFRFFLDGVERPSAIDLGQAGDEIDSVRQSDSPVVVGARLTGGIAYDRFDGQLDEIRIWNVLRSPAAIAANYRAELTGSEPGLIGYWPLENSGEDQTSAKTDLLPLGTPPPTFSADTPF